MSYAFFLTLADDPNESERSALLDPFAPLSDDRNGAVQPRKRLAEIQSESAARCRNVDRQIRSRLGAPFEVQFLDGISGWTVRTESRIVAQTLRGMLAGIPVTIAENSEFEAH